MSDWNNFPAYSQSLRTNATWVSIHNLPSMSTLEVNDEEVSLGSALSIADMVLSIDIYCDESISRPIRKLFDKFSSLQVMNVAVCFQCRFFYQIQNEHFSKKFLRF